MPPNPDRVARETAAGAGARPIRRAAPWLFGAAMLGVICANAVAFAHFQDPDTPVPWVHLDYQPIQLRSQRPQGPWAPQCYYPLRELLGERTVVVPAGTRFPVWEWRHLGLVQVEVDTRPSLLFPALEARLRQRGGKRFECGYATVHLPVDPGSGSEALYALPTIRKPREFFLVEASQAVQQGERGAP